LERQNMKRRLARRLASEKPLGPRPGKDKIGVKTAVVESFDRAALGLGEIGNREHRAVGPLRKDQRNLGGKTARNTAHPALEPARRQRQRRPRGEGVRPLGKSHRTDRLAARKTRKPRRLLIVRPVKRYRLGYPEARGQKGRPAQRAPRLMRNQTKLDQPQIKTP